MAALMLAGLALFIPGFALWAWLTPPKPNAMTALAVIGGGSLSFFALLGLAGFYLNLQWGQAGMLGLLLVLLGLAIWGLVRRRVHFGWAWLPAIGLTGLIIVWRLLQAQSLLMPAWVDSLHHVLIVRKMIESGGVPADLSPYLALPFYYHYAFHYFTAWFAQMGGSTPAQAVLVMGQVLNALICLSVYRFAHVTWGNKKTALFAALLTAFVTHMPAYYLTWGRYTLITGLVLLPLAMAEAVLLLRNPRAVRHWLLLALFTAGTLLAHYFAAFLLVLFLVGLWLHALWRQRHTLRHHWHKLALLPACALTGLLLALPWLLRAFAMRGNSLGVDVVAPDAINNGAYLWYLLGPARNHVLFFAALAGLGLVLWQRKARPFALWCLAVAALALPWGLRITPFRPDHYVIIAFFPLALLVGWLLVALGRYLTRLTRLPWAGGLLSLLLMAGLLGWGISTTRQIINPVTVLTTADDLQALAWIDENLPQDARFFVNTTAWQGNATRAVDGSAWLLPLTARWSVSPTIFYGFGTDKAAMRQISDWGRRASGINTCSADFLALVEEAALTHIYIREGVGSLQPTGLLGCPGIDAVYHQGGVWVYALGQ